MERLKTMVARVEEWPTGLVSAREIAVDIGLSEQRIAQLADAGYWPHYRLDGGSPMFKKNESKQWAAKHLMQRFEGETPAIEFKVMLAATGTVRSMPPPCLHGLRGLTELTQFLQPPGVYFLCQAEEVVYVGQSTQPATRIATHLTERAKVFDRVYFIAIPEFLLNDVEREFIALFKPRLNVSGGPPLGDTGHADVAKAVVAQLTAGLAPTLEHAQ